VALRNGLVHLFVRPSVAKMRIQKRERDFSQKLSNLEPLVPHPLFKEPIIEPLKFTMAKIRHLENRQIVISQRKSCDFN